MVVCMLSSGTHGPWRTDRTNRRRLPESIMQLDDVWMAEPTKYANFSKHNSSILQVAVYVGDLLQCHLHTRKDKLT